MKRLAIAALLLSSAGPAWAQEPAPDKTRRELERLKAEAAHKDARLAELQKQLGEAQMHIRKQEADLQVFMRQVEAQLAQIQELSARVEADRAERAKAAEELEARKAAEQLLRSVYQHRVTKVPPPTTIPTPAPAPAEAPQWHPSTPRVLVPADPTSAPLPKGSADELRALRSELDAVRRQVRVLSDRLLPSFQEPGATFEPLSEEFRAYLGLEGGVIVRQVREGSPAARAGLQPGDLVPSRTEDNVLDALRQGHPFEVVRRGRTILIPAVRSR